MKIKDIFKEVLVGYNLSNTSVNDDNPQYHKTLQKDSIQYCNIIPSRLIDKPFNENVKEKYFLQERDIIIFVKHPYRVGTYTRTDKLDLVIPSNFIILRGINMDLYSYIFIANYLENIGIKKFKENSKVKTSNLTKEDIENIEIPNIPKETQMTISPLLNAINERSSIYADILENDNKVVLYAINSIVGDKDVK